MTSRTVDATCTLEACTYENTQTFGLKDQVLPAKCLDLYDGDTGTFAVTVHGNAYKFKMRLSGIDTPEIRPSKSNPNRDEEKEAARYVRNRVLQLVSDQSIDLNKKYTKREIKQMLAANKKIVFLKCGKCGKFGRTLIKIFLSEEDVTDKSRSVNKILLREGLAYKYYGGSKNRDFTSYFRQPLRLG
jgi:endonuclease YncB( thermonuclease family)